VKFHAIHQGDVAKERASIVQSLPNLKMVNQEMVVKQTKLTNEVFLGL
jgi:hypothetical protein